VTEIAKPSGGFRGRPHAAATPRWLAGMPAAGWAWWIVVVAPASAALVYSLASLHHGGWLRFTVLTVAASVAQLTAVLTRRVRIFHPAIVFAVAGALILSPEQLVLMCVLQHVPDWWKQRYLWYIQPFNIANYVFATLAALELAHGFHHLAGDSGAAVAGAGVAAAIGFVVVNRALLLPMLRLGRSLRIRETGLFAIDDLALELVLALMAVALVALWHRSIALAAISLAPLVLIHFTQRATSRLEQASDTISEQNESLEEAHRMVMERSTSALKALSATVDARDQYTAGHSNRVAKIAKKIAAQHGLEGDELETVEQAALLHDIGKIGVPDAVLLKSGELTQADWMVMRSHPEAGARIIERLGYLDDVVPAIRYHHERPDGRGYPEGLIGDEIPVAARIIHVADALDAMRTDRVYRSALSLDRALWELRCGADTDFDRDCVEALERALAAGELEDVLPSGRAVA
jgi:putative nucleotidyltransferase with HDIG domain